MFLSISRLCQSVSVATRLQQPMLLQQYSGGRSLLVHYKCNFRDQLPEILSSFNWLSLSSTARYSKDAQGEFATAEQQRRSR